MPQENPSAFDPATAQPGLAAAWASIAHEAMLLADDALRIVWANPAFERLTGWSPAAAAGQGLEVLLDGADDGERRARAAALAARFRGLALPVRELAFAARRADGSGYAGRMDIAPLDGATRFAIVLRDDPSQTPPRPADGDAVWRRIEAARQMRRVGVCEVGLRSGHVFWDEHVHAFYGRDLALGPMSTEEAIAAIHPDDREAAIAAWDRSMIDGVGEARYRVVHADGSMRRIHSEWRVRADEGDEPRAVGVLFDDTDAYMLARRLDEGLVRLQAAEAASRAKSEFLSHMSHELRTPLNAILGFAQLLQVDALESGSRAQQERIGRIEQAGWHLLGLIDEVLDLSRVEAGTIDWQWETVELAPVLEVAHSLLQTQARDSSIWLEMPDTAACAGRAVRADRKRLLQVLVNLIGNAIKYNRPGGSVEVAVERVEATAAQAATIVVHVRDTGLGLTPQQHADLFVPFNRLGRQHGQVQGTGLGLAITHKLVLGMGGRIEVESEAGVGSCFSVSLPAAAT